jgi:hypothetical protein
MATAVLGLYRCAWSQAAADTVTIFQAEKKKEVETGARGVADALRLHWGPCTDPSSEFLGTDTALASD